MRPLIKLPPKVDNVYCRRLKCSVMIGFKGRQRLTKHLQYITLHSMEFNGLVSTFFTEHWQKNVLHTVHWKPRGSELWTRFSEGPAKGMQFKSVRTHTHTHTCKPNVHRTEFVLCMLFHHYLLYTPGDHVYVFQLY